MPKRAETGIRVSLLYTLPAPALEPIFCALRSLIGRYRGTVGVMLGTRIRPELHSRGACDSSACNLYRPQLYSRLV